MLAILPTPLTLFLFGFISSLPLSLVPNAIDSAFRRGWQSWHSTLTVLFIAYRPTVHCQNGYFRLSHPFLCPQGLEECR